MTRATSPFGSITRNADASRSTNSVESPAKGMSAPAPMPYIVAPPDESTTTFGFARARVEQNDLALAGIVDQHAAVGEGAEMLDLRERHGARRERRTELANGCS